MPSQKKPKRINEVNEFSASCILLFAKFHIFVVIKSSRSALVVGRVLLISHQGVWVCLTLIN